MYTVRFGSACNTFAIISSNTPVESIIARQNITEKSCDGLLGLLGFTEGREYGISAKIHWVDKNRVDHISFNLGQDHLLASEMLELLQSQSQKQFQTNFIDCECREKPENKVDTELKEDDLDIIPDTDGADDEAEEEEADAEADADADAEDSGSEPESEEDDEEQIGSS
jgi:hypothetical protein